ncbi:MAG: SAM-dependent chlorinase/fluorinase [Cyanobacteria bacterium J06638_6]
MTIALITDFGTQDNYVGVMKGVIAAIAPQSRCIDLTHAIPPQDLYATRFTLLSAYPYMPADTVYLVVVDPGVGTQRRAVAVQTERGWLVGPDNGVLSGVFSQAPILTAVELSNADYWRLAQPSATFHGRDIFAPVAAHLHNGVPIEQLGPPIEPQSLVQLPLIQPTAIPNGWIGAVQYIDRFGNAATTISASAVQPGPWQLRLGTRMLPGLSTYGEVAVSEGLALIGSHGFVEAAVNRGSAQQRFGIAVGDRITLTRL